MNEMHIVSFNSTNQAIKCDKVFESSNIRYAVLPTPREITKSCGTSIRFLLEDIEQIKNVIEENQIEYKGMYTITKLEDGKRKVETID